MANLLGFGQGPAEFLTLIAANVLLGLVVAVLQAFYFERRLARKDRPDGVRQGHRRHLATIGLVVGLLAAAMVALVGEPRWAVTWGLAEAVLYLLIVRNVYGQSYRSEIRTVETLTWSWSRALKLALAGLILAILAEGIESLLFQNSGATRNVLTIVLATLLLGGISRKELVVRTEPYQGIWLSLRNALASALVAGLLLGLLTWILAGAPTALATGLLVALLFLMLFGGSHVFRHFIVRGLLRLNGQIPWRYSRFLDYAAGLVFLRKVGGGYIFMHGLLQDYFASESGNKKALLP
jgi:hypothetical protein